MELRSKWKDDRADAKEVMAVVETKSRSDSARGDADFVNVTGGKHTQQSICVIRGGRECKKWGLAGRGEVIKE